MVKKKWSSKVKYINDNTCDELKGRINFIRKQYGNKHDSKNTIEITLDDNIIATLSHYDENCACCDFPKAFDIYHNSKIQDTLNSDNDLAIFLALIDKRVGKRTLKKMKYNILLDKLSDKNWKSYNEIILNEILNNKLQKIV